jgi:para-nitrobenzyl esterase
VISSCLRAFVVPFPFPAFARPAYHGRNEPEETVMPAFLDRRALLGGVAAMSALPVLGAGRARAAGDPVIDTSSGKIRGVDQDGILSFKGVPYGAPTGGRNRFLAPQKPEPWAGVRDALVWAGRAPQADAGPRRPEHAGLSGKPDPAAETEDCLVLNLWTPGPGKRPVMVWYHGGAFSYGSSNGDRLDGGNLARRHDVVVVTVNQRLNVFGHLHLGDLGGPEFASSANAGTLDMVAALEWVRDNIARFGGDPGNVTIFGQSGGGAKVSTLLQMPAARGLFHKAIVMSGSVVRLRDRERAQRLTEAVLREVGVARNELGRLQSLPMAQLRAAIGPAEKAIGPAASPLFDRYAFGPMVDGTIVPSQPFDPAVAAVSDHVPVLVGGVKDEMAIYLAPDDAVWNRTLSEAELETRVRKVAGDDTARVLETYRRLYPAVNPAERLIAITTDSNFRIRTLLQAERLAARNQAPAYLYSFDWETPLFDGRLKAFHAIDVPFAFDTIDQVGSTDRGAVAHALATTVSTSWATFARTGSPDNGTIPHWPAYSLGAREALILDRDCRIERDPRGETRLLWEDITRS